jgi:hypothetical protein
MKPLRILIMNVFKTRKLYLHVNPLHDTKQIPRATLRQWWARTKYDLGTLSLPISFKNRPYYLL